MFDHFTDTQSFADAVRQIVQRDVMASTEERAAAMRTIQKFEMFDWDVETMQRTLEALNIHDLRMEGDQLVYDRPDIAVLVLDVMLGHYMEKMQRLDSNEYTMREAAVYLGVSMAQLEDYVFNQQLIKPLRRGDALVFGRELLEAYARPETSQQSQAKFEG
jgi:hypothetical protein